MPAVKKKPSRLHRVKSSFNLKNSFSKLLYSTQLEMQHLKIERKKMTPPLNVFTRTPKNMSRFVARVGFLADFTDWFADIITWQTSSNTLVALMIWSLFCLNPYLLLIVPQVLITTLAMRYYYKRSGFVVREQSLVVKGKTPVWSKEKHNLHFYTRNAQWIQNFMAMHSDAYDKGKKLKRLLDWRDANATRTFLLYVWLSIPCSLVFFYFVPFKWLIMFAGVFAVLGNSPPGRALIMMSPELLFQFKKQIKWTEAPFLVKMLNVETSRNY